MKRALVAIATGLLVATFVPIGSAGAGPVSRQAAASSCESGEAPSVEVVLLVDQSTSLRKGDGLEAIEVAVEQVGNRLLIPVQDGLDVKFGAAKFGETASTVQPLQPVEDVDFEQLGGDLSNEATLEGFTDYVQGLEEAIGLFDSGDPQACKVLLWFTDGMVDLPPYDYDDSRNDGQAEADALLSEVCGDERPMARRIGSKGIVTFAVLLNTEEKINEWNSKYENLGAGLSSMQAIAGVAEIDVPKDHVADDKCAPFIAENSELGGEVLVGPGELAGILSARLCEALGCTPVGQCPETVPAGDSGLFPKGGMPPGVMLSNVYVTAVAGEIGSVSAVLPDGTREPLSDPNPDDNRLVETELEALPGGWQLEIENAAEEQAKVLDVCIQYDKPRLEAGQVTVSPSPEEVVFEEQETIELRVDWSKAFGDIDPAGVIGKWELSGDRLKVTTEETLSDPNSVVDVEVAELGDAADDEFELDSVTLTVTPQGSDEQVVFKGEIKPSIKVRTDSDRPRLECSEDGEHGFGYSTIGGAGDEVAEDKLYESEGTCTVFPPKNLDPNGQGFVAVTFGSDDSVMPWELQTADGAEVSSPFKVSVGDDPVVLKVATSEGLENGEYIAGGLLTLSTEWSRNADYAQEATFGYRVELIPRSDPGQALIITVIVTAIAMLLSLALLRLMNYLLVKIPEPGAFYFRVVSVKITPDPVLGATWSPTGDGFASDSRPVGADSPGRDLKAGPMRVQRSLGPVWKPFAAPFSRLKGDRVIRATPPGRRPGTAPVAFPSLTALMTSGNERSTDGTYAGQIVVLYPRRHEFDETQVREDVDRLVGSVGEDVVRLTPELSDHTQGAPNDAGSPAPTPPGAEPAPRGPGPSAPPTRSGPPAGPARDTTTSDREPPPREPPRREPPPRGR